MRSWMIRHFDLSITRPMPESEVIQKIEAGEISPQDELAPANGYWFTLQEAEEVKAHFGKQIVLKSMIPVGGETTSSTNTTLEEPTQEKKNSMERSEARVSARASFRLANTRPKLNKPALTRESNLTLPARSQFAFGLFLSAIFVGTLLLLWSGSR